MAEVEQVRFFPKDADRLAFTPTDRCEVCELIIRDHEWVDLDHFGVAFDCSLKWTVSWMS